MNKKYSAKDLRLPVGIKGEAIYLKKSLSMDEYLKFVEAGLRRVNIEELRKQKRELMVDVPFKL